MDGTSERAESLVGTWALSIKPSILAWVRGMELWKVTFKPELFKYLIQLIVGWCQWWMPG
jgi:hypothetical protein